MKRQQPSRARVQPSFRSWAAFAAILLIAQFFAVAPPLGAQNPPSSVPDSFAALQRRLDAAADNQLALVKAAPLLTTSSIPRSIAVTQSTNAVWHDPVEFFALRRAESPERPAGSPGIDARSILVQEGVPVELLGVARIESNFNPSAVSPKGAAGLWQFMPETARRYGLRVDVFQDDRFDVNKSTRAAARYLRDLYAEFGDWPLAFAAYNAGEDTVHRAIERTSNRDFKSINRAGLLPSETRAYVPAVLKAIDFIGGERSALKPPIGMN